MIGLSCHLNTSYPCKTEEPLQATAFDIRGLYVAKSGRCAWKFTSMLSHNFELAIQVVSKASPTAAHQEQKIITSILTEHKHLGSIQQACALKCP